MPKDQARHDRNQRSIVCVGIEEKDKNKVMVFEMRCYWRTLNI